MNKELTSIAEVHKNDPVIDEEECYDLHSCIKEFINDAEMNENDLVNDDEEFFD